MGRWGVLGGEAPRLMKKADPRIFSDLRKRFQPPPHRPAVVAHESPSLPDATFTGADVYGVTAGCGQRHVTAT